MSSTQASAAAYLLQDSRGNTGDNLMFWAKSGGYTSNVADAEEFSEEEAFAKNRSRHSDVPWPAAYVAARTRRVVDMQYVNRSEESTHVCGPAPAYYLQDRNKRYIGNDILFVAKDGKSLTTDLSEALLSMAERNEHTLELPWLKEYIDLKGREALSAKNATLTDALNGTTSELAKAPRVQPERYRCHGCGVYISAATYYASECNRCGTSNRP